MIEVGLESFHLYVCSVSRFFSLSKLTLVMGYYVPVIAAQQDALQQKNNVHKMQEAKAAANKYEGFASQKRQRAQMLMENADLATYKAMMALRIAEAAAAAAQVDESPEGVVASILD